MEAHITLWNHKALPGSSDSLLCVAGKGDTIPAVSLLESWARRMESLKPAWATQQDPGFLDKSSGREQLLKPPTSGVANISTKAEAAWLRAEHDFHTNYFHSVQDVSRRNFESGFYKGIWLPSHLLWAWSSWISPFQNKRNAHGKGNGLVGGARSSDGHTVCFVLFCFQVCLPGFFFSFTPLGNVVENLIAYPVSFKYCQSPRFIY